jgi:hypothetical protein
MVFLIFLARNSRTRSSQFSSLKEVSFFFSVKLEERNCFTLKQFLSSSLTEKKKLKKTLPNIYIYIYIYIIFGIERQETKARN